MKSCPQCGFHHIDTDARCVRCGARLDAAGGGAERGGNEPGIKKLTLGGGEVARWRLRWPALAAAWVRRRLYFLRRVMESELPSGVHHRNPWTAGALSLIPGCGQLYNHQFKKALLLFILLGFWLVMVALTFYHPLSNWVIYAYAMAMAWAFHDGFTTAKRINREYLSRQHAIAFYCAWVLYLGLFYVALHYLGHQHFVFQMRQARDTRLEPLVGQGEKFIVDCVTPRLRPPRLGELVAFRPNAIQIRMWSFEVVDNTLKEEEFFSRVVGGPGDTLERRGGTFYRNGEPLAAEALLKNIDFPAEFKLTAPADHYLILITHHGMFKSMFIKGPASYQVTNWEEACVIPRKAIWGRVRCVYDPPPARRWVDGGDETGR